MDRKFLEGLGLEKEAVDAVLNQNGSEVTALKTQLATKETEVATLRGDLTAANTKIVGLEKVDTEGLQKQLDDERNGRIKDKKEFALKSLLSQSGCKDIDYVLYKLGDTVEFDEKGEIKDAESFINTTKETYASQFAKEPAEPRSPVLSGVTPAQSGDPINPQKPAPATLTGAIEAAVKAQQEGR